MTYQCHEIHLTPPITPYDPPNNHSESISVPSPLSSPEFCLPPPIPVPANLDLDAQSFSSFGPPSQEGMGSGDEEDPGELFKWSENMTAAQRDAREEWLAGGRGRKGLRIVIVTENFLPKVDGVTRTLSLLLSHLSISGHQCILLGPSSSLNTYAQHPLVGTLGIPLVVYPGLKLNFLRPKFLTVIREWGADVVHFVDPIWLGAQVMLGMELGWAGEKWVAETGPAFGQGLGGAVVASYHTNLATYATLFGLPFLTPLIYAFQQYLYSKTLLTLCPSPSTQSTLLGQGFDRVNIWPRGVDLRQFSPLKRSAMRRAKWGVGDAPGGNKDNKAMVMEMGVGGLMTPPMTPENGPLDPTRPLFESQCTSPQSRCVAVELPERVILLYVGRLSWEKNLHLLLSAYSSLLSLLCQASPTTAFTALPKLIFVGDGPARAELELKCNQHAWDAEFLGHKSGEELGECFASADVFVFPSFTETFGQVILEALASGLPVVGLDAEGTRDLVSHTRTGLLLPLPTPRAKSSSPSWNQACKPSSPTFSRTSNDYAKLLKIAVTDHDGRREMGMRASVEGLEGRTWFDAMESCVDGYREAIALNRQKRTTQIIAHSSTTAKDGTLTPPTLTYPKRVSVVNRVVSRRLVHRDCKRSSWSGGWVGSKREGGDGSGWGDWTLKIIHETAVIFLLIYFFTHFLSQIAVVPYFDWLSTLMSPE